MCDRDCKITNIYYPNEPNRVKEMHFDYGGGVYTRIISPNITPEEDARRKEDLNKIAIRLWRNIQKRIIIGLEDRGLCVEDVIIDAEEDKNNVRVYLNVKDGQKGQYLFSHRDINLKNRESNVITC